MGFFIDRGVGSDADAASRDHLWDFHRGAAQPIDLDNSRADSLSAIPDFGRRPPPRYGGG
jgi:hypothetical protein